MYDIHCMRYDLIKSSFKMTKIYADMLSVPIIIILYNDFKNILMILMINLLTFGMAHFGTFSKMEPLRDIFHNFCKYI